MSRSLLASQSRLAPPAPSAFFFLRICDPRRDGKYVRAQVLRAAFIMRPNAQDPANRTDFTHVTQLNPGGVLDSWLGAQVVNMIYASAADLVPALEAAAKRPAEGMTTTTKTATAPHVAGVQVT